MREIFPVKYYKDEGFLEYKLDIHDEDLREIIQEYLWSHAKFDFDELEVVNNRPMNVWLHAKCRRYIDPDGDVEEQTEDVEAVIPGKYDGNPIS